MKKIIVNVTVTCQAEMIHIVHKAIKKSSAICLKHGDYVETIIPLTFLRLQTNGPTLSEFIFSGYSVGERKDAPRIVDTENPDENFRVALERVEDE